jgi:hypothetical protein
MTVDTARNKLAQFCKKMIRLLEDDLIVVGIGHYATANTTLSTAEDRMLEYTFPLPGDEDNWIIRVRKHKLTLYPKRNPRVAGIHAVLRIPNTAELYSACASRLRRQERAQEDRDAIAAASIIESVFDVEE